MIAAGRIARELTRDRKIFFPEKCGEIAMEKYRTQNTKY